MKVFIVFGSETWVVKPRIGRLLGGLHHRVAHRLTRQQPRKGRDIGWVYIPLAEAMAEEGLQKSVIDVSG